MACVWPCRADRHGSFKTVVVGLPTIWRLGRISLRMPFDAHCQPRELDNLGTCNRRVKTFPCSCGACDGFVDQIVGVEGRNPS